MKKNLVLRPVILAIYILSFLYSCRSEDLLSNNEEEYSSKFKVFSNQEKEKIDYGKGFKTLLERYDSIHNVQHTPKALKKAWKNSSAMSDEYIEFNIRSQDITTKNKEVYTLFPLIRNHQVSGIIIAVLKNEDTYVEYLKMSPEAENYDTILELFRAQYIKSTLQNKNNTSKGSGGPCGFEGAPPCNIDTIIIIVPGGGSGGGGLPPGGGGGPSGGCGPYEDCIHKPDDGGGGGGETTPTNPTQNPCEKTKSLLNKPKVQQGINDVKAQALKTLSDMKAGEIGFKEPKNGGPLVSADVNEAHKVVFNDVTDSYGGYHNHTATGTHMFSPPDIVDALFGFAAAQSAQDGVGNAYLGMIATEWCNTCPNNVQYIHYVIKYTGTGSELGGYVYTPAQMKQFEKDYQETVDNLTDKSKNGTTYIKNSAGDLNEKGLEKLFFDTLKNIGIYGKVNLQRVEANGTINNVTLDSNGLPTGAPCP